MHSQNGLAGHEPGKSGSHVLPVPLPASVVPQAVSQQRVTAHNADGALGDVARVHLQALAAKGGGESLCKHAGQLTEDCWTHFSMAFR